MSNTQRVQLALNVDNIDEAINYYEKLFNTKVSKVKSKYANFAIDNPPLKLVLMENKNAALRINHLGVETFEQNDVDNALARFNQHHIRHSEYENERDCCYAKQNKVWSKEPSTVSQQAIEWEWYRKLADAETF